MKKPNIVLITTDQMRSDAFGRAGNDIIQTVAIDHLAARGVQFDHAYSSHPVCIPARASIMTGLEGHTMGLTEYIEGFELPTDQTLPQLLRDEGYQTKVVGKMHTYPERRHYGFESMLLCEEGRRFGQANDEHRGYDDYENWLAEKGYSGEGFSHGMANNAHSMTSWHLPDRLHVTEWTGTETCKAIKTRDWTRPLFLWASFTAPHPPLTPLMKDLLIYDESEMPEPMIGDWVKDAPIFHQTNLAVSQGDDKKKKEIALAYRAYYGLITQVDRQINRIIGTLREEGLLENTWFIFTSDHGDSMGDHQLWGKRTFLKGSTQIPFIITPPTKGDLDQWMESDWKPGEISSAVVGLQDILPTCLAIAGIPIPERLDGKNLLPVVHKPETKVRETILGEIGHPGDRSFMLTDGLWKYIWSEADGRELLFQIKEDPDELINLANGETNDLKKWRSKLIERLRERSDDRAVKDNQLNPSNPGMNLSLLQKARLRTDHNVRGLH